MNEPTPSDPPPVPRAPAPAPRRGLRISLPAVVVGLALVGSAAYIAYVVLGVSDEQIPLLAMGFVVLGASFVAIALWSLVGMWRAASRARGGRALGLAIFGGLAGMAAIGCFTVAALAALVWTS